MTCRLFVETKKRILNPIQSAAKNWLSVRRAIINKEENFLNKIGVLAVQHLNLPSLATGASFDIRPAFLAALQPIWRTWNFSGYS